jgi:hypothetical protein
VSFSTRREVPAATPPPIPQTAKQVTPSEFATPKSRPLTEYVSDFVKEMQDPAKRAKLSPYHEAVAKHFQSTVAPRSSRFSSGFLKKEAVARGVAVTDLPEDVLKQANESAQQQSAEYIQNATKLADFAQAHGVSPDDFQKAFDKAAEGPADGLTPDKVFPELAQGEPKAKTTPPPPPPPKAKTTPPPIPADAKKTEVKKQPAPGEGGVDWDAIGRDVGMRAGGLARAASRLRFADIDTSAEQAHQADVAKLKQRLDPMELQQRIISQNRLLKALDKSAVGLKVEHQTEFRQWLERTWFATPKLPLYFNDAKGPKEFAPLLSELEALVKLQAPHRDEEWRRWLAAELQSARTAGVAERGRVLTVIQPRIPRQRRNP